MTSLLQAVNDKAGVVRTRVTWSYIKTHLSKDKIIVFILIALQWVFATASLLLFFILPENQKEMKEPSTSNGTEMEFSAGCNLTNIGNTRVEDCIYENFYFDNSTNSCVPNCYTWISYTPAISAAIDGLARFLSCMATFVSLAVLLIACFRRNKALFQFPSVLVVYMSLLIMLRYAFIASGFIDQHKLFCTSKNLLENYISPTLFCQFAGASNDYYTVQLCIWVSCHIFSIYFLICHPLQAQQFFHSSKLKYVHLCVVLVGLLAPLLGPVTTILHFLSDPEDPERLGYTVVLYPPNTCRNTMRSISFFTVIFPFNLMFTTSVSLLILILWKLVKGKQLAEAKIGTADKKILVTLCYFVLLNYTVPLSHTILEYNYEQFEKKQAAFFKCASLNGISEPTQIKEAINPGVMILGWLLRPCFPFFLLAYVIDFQKLGKWLAEKKSMVFSTQRITIPSQASSEASSIKSQASSTKS